VNVNVSVLQRVVVLLAEAVAAHLLDAVVVVISLLGRTIDGTVITIVVIVVIDPEALMIGELQSKHLLCPSTHV